MYHKPTDLHPVAVWPCSCVDFRHRAPGGRPITRLMELSEEQRASLALFREVTAEARDEAASIEVLKSCNWNVEQALSLHWASHDEDHGAQARAPAAAGANPLSAPLLPGHGRSSAATHGSTAGDSPGSMAYGLFSRIAQGIKQIGFSVLSLVYTFFFGTGGGALGSSGAAFRRALQTSYGTPALPEFHDGSFSQAVTRARQDLKLLVVYLHSEHARHSQSVCSDVLANEVIRTVLDENFILWGGDVARMEAHQVARMIHARQFPSFCVLLPASVEEIRVIGALHGQIEAEGAQALLAACMEEMETHRAEIVAQQVQRVEDRYLREQQDREYQEALEMDRRRTEEREAQRRQEEEERRQAEEEQRKAQEEMERRNAEVWPPSCRVPAARRAWPCGCRQDSGWRESLSPPQRCKRSMIGPPAWPSCRKIQTRGLRSLSALY